MIVAVASVVVVVVAAAAVMLLLLPSFCCCFCFITKLSIALTHDFGCPISIARGLAVP